MDREVPEFVEVRALNGRKNKKYSPSERMMHCQEWQKSGLSMNEYCRRSGLLISTFSQWAKQFKDKEKSQCNSESKSSPDYDLQMIEITLINGIRLRFTKLTAVSEMVRLVKALQLCN